MKRSTAGVSVRFFNVTTLTGHGRDGRSSGSIFRDFKCATDRGIEVINRPSARKWVITADLGAEVLPGSSAEFGKLIADETEKWAKVVKFSGAKPD